MGPKLPTVPAGQLGSDDEDVADSDVDETATRADALVTPPADTLDPEVLRVDDITEPLWDPIVVLMVELLPTAVARHTATRLSPVTSTVA